MFCVDVLHEFIAGRYQRTVFQFEEQVDGAVVNGGNGSNGFPVGTIAAIDDQTANILFELEDGTLIPANDDLIIDIDTTKRQITMSLPEGLLALH